MAAALQFLRESGHPDFKDSEATEFFCRVFDCIFDLLNSRSPFATGFKTATTPDNLAWVKSHFCEAKRLLLSLQTVSVKGSFPVADSARTASVIGLIFCMDSVLSIAECCLSKSPGVNKLLYVLTYKFSQDHLELLFNAVRRAGIFV